MKIIVALLAIVVAATIGYGFYRNTEMHKELTHRLSYDKTIVAEAGNVISYEYLSSGSDCNYGGSCNESLWIFAVTGEIRCIKVLAVLHEQFPNYFVKSVSPATYWESVNDSEFQEVIHQCT